MTVQFSKHAIQRLGERFPHAAQCELWRLIEQAIAESRGIMQRRLEVEGRIKGRAVRIVLAEKQVDEFELVTVMWLRSA